MGLLSRRLGREPDAQARATTSPRAALSPKSPATVPAGTNAAAIAVRPIAWDGFD